MAYQRYSPTGDRHYIADAIIDLADLPIGSMGDTCSVIENGGLYTRNSKNEWIRTDIPMASVEQEAIDRKRSIRGSTSRIYPRTRY